MDLIKIENTLLALEKASKKARKAIDLYNSSVNIQHVNRIYFSDHPRHYFNKAARILKTAEKEHEIILSNLWEQGIFI